MPEACSKQPLLGIATETMSIIDRTIREKEGKHREVQQNPRSIGKRKQSGLPKPLRHTEEMILPAIRGL